VIKGGGFSVTGSGSVTGYGVMIYNAGSNYPGTGGTFGSINWNSSGNINLTPMSTGIYAGVLLFQSRDNSAALSMTGSHINIPGSVVYAPSATLTANAPGQLPGAYVVGTLTVNSNTIINGLPSTGTTVYTPAQVRGAYGINSLALDGTGQTIAIVDAYDNPAIFESVNSFDQQFSLTTGGPTLYDLYGPAAAFLTVVNQQGQSGALPATDPSGPGASNWEMESALDVEWAHAAAPGARIILVEANSQSLADLMASVATAAGQPGVSVVSMSWGFPEGSAVLAQDEALYDHNLTTPAGHTGVTFVASTGDYGAAYPEYPAYSPNVVAVGGTSLYLNSDGSYANETGWGYFSSDIGGFIGSGGGASLYEPAPSYQQGVQSTGFRTTPDVSLVADPNTGVWMADTYNLPGDNPWQVVGGTSLSAPAWAGLFALVNQARAGAGTATLNTTSPTEAQQALYNVPVSDFNAITSRSNGFQAGPGYNLVAGLGTPVANLLIPDLAAYNGAISTQRSVMVTASTLANGSGGSGASSGPINALVFDAFVVATPGNDVARALGTSAGQGGSTGFVVAASRQTVMSEKVVSALGHSGLGNFRATLPYAGLEAKIGQLTAVQERVGQGAIDRLLGDGVGTPVAGPMRVDFSEGVRVGNSDPEVLVAGDGSDMVMGGEGRGILIGGFGDDQATAVQDGNLLLVAGTADYRGGTQALDQAVAEWVLGDEALRQSGDLLDVGNSGWDGSGVAGLALGAFLWEEAGEA
jgi:subtilase family serine protease